MRILLAQNSLYYPAHGGGDKSNRLLMEALAARGHTCLAVARISRFGPAEHAQYLRDLAARAVSPVERERGVVVFPSRGRTGRTSSRVIPTCAPTSLPRFPRLRPISC